MKSLVSQFEGLAEREGFNSSVRHIKTVVSIVDSVAAKENLADIVDELIEEKIFDKGRCASRWYPWSSARNIITPRFRPT